MPIKVEFQLFSVPTCNNFFCPQGNNALRKDTPKADRQDVLNHLQNYNTLKENSPREKTHKDDNLLQKRDRSPPRSPHFSSLETEEMIARAKTVLQAIREQGCPTKDGMNVLGNCPPTPPLA